MAPCVIYGTGDWGKRAYRELSDKYDIRFYVDRNPQKEGMEVNGCPVHHPDILKNHPDMKVFIAIRDIDGIPEYLMSLGVKSFQHFIPKGVTMIPVPYLKGSESGRLRREAPWRLAKKLLEYDIVSFDAFDTLILRKCAYPTFIFYMMESESGMRDFHYLRETAERKVREKHKKVKGCDEVTLYDIYEYIAPRTGMTVEEGVRAEMEMEKSFCFANPYMKTVFDMLKQEGKRIIITSDMYLTKDQLAELLKHCGYEGYEEIFISSETKRNKGTGEAYRKIRQIYGEELNYVHIGDNFFTDVIMAEKKHWDAGHYLNVNIAGRIHRADGMSDMVGPVYVGIVNAHIYNGLYEYSPAYEYGFIYGGLYILGYVNWVHQYAVEHHLEKILFLARDGDIYKQVYDRYYHDIPSEYVYWSRLSTEKFDVAWNRYQYISHIYQCIVEMEGKPYSVKDLLRERDIEFLEDKLTEYDFTLDTILSEENVEEFTDMLMERMDEILLHYEENRTYLLRYLDDVIGNANSMAIVDIGWYGSGPDALRNILKRYRKDKQVQCFLAGAGLSTLVQRGFCRPYIFSFMQNRNHYDAHHGFNHVKKANIVFEMFNASCTPSFEGMHGKDGDMTFKFSLPFVEGYEDIREFHRGTLDFCKSYMDLAEKYPYLKDISGYDAYLPFRVALREFNYYRNNFHDYPIEPEVGNQMEPVRLGKYI